MMGNKYAVIMAVCAILMLSGVNSAAGEDYIKNIEVGEAEIKFAQNEFPHAAYLYVDFKNNGAKEVANLTFEITYYDKEEYLMKKAVVKNALNAPIPPEEARKYKIRLKGKSFNERNDQYPYSQSHKVGEFDIKILSVKFGRK